MAFDRAAVLLGRGDALLSQAITERDPETARRLLSAGADPDSWHDGEPLLVLAARTCPGCVSALLEAGADIGAATTRNGVSALETAFAWCRADCAGALLEGGADPKDESIDGRPVLAWLASVGDAEGVGLLASKTHPDGPRSRRDGGTAFQEAAAAGRVDCMRVLEALGANPLLVTGRGTALLDSAWRGRSESVKAILEMRGGLPETLLQAGDALHTAVMSAHLDDPLRSDGVSARSCARLLLDAGADPNHAPTYGMTPLHRAASYGEPGMIRMLLDAGADPCRIDHGGSTPLDAADCDECAGILREAMARAEGRELGSSMAAAAAPTRKRRL